MDRDDWLILVGGMGSAFGMLLIALAERHPAHDANVNGTLGIIGVLMVVAGLACTLRAAP